MIHRVLAYQSHLPKLGERVFVAPGARVIGDVTIGDHTSIWFNTVVRGDVFHIRIGKCTNIQDLSMIHVTRGRHPSIIGDHVTVGHRAILHGCTISDCCLIGMGAIVMDRATIGEHSIIGAGAVVTEGTVIPPGTLALGFPAKPKRELTEVEIHNLKDSANHYAKLAAQYLDAEVDPCPKS